jgi:uncharacterized membrane protein
MLRRELAEILFVIGLCFLFAFCHMFWFIGISSLSLTKTGVKYDFTTIFANSFKLYFQHLAG